jgi:hypothetical protein
MFSLGTQVVRNRTTTRTEIKSFKLFFSHFISSLLYPVHSFISVYRIQFLFSFNISITSYMTSLLHQRETIRFTHSFTCNCFFSNRYKSNEKLSNPKPKTHTHAQKEGIKIRIKLWFRSGFATVLPPIIVRQKSSQKGKKKGHTSARCQTIQPISIHLPCSIVVYWVWRQRHTELENKINKSAEPMLHSNEKEKRKNCI